MAQQPVLQDLNFKVSPEFHQIYKLVATLKGITMRELLEKSFRDWVKRHGDAQINKLLRL